MDCGGSLTVVWVLRRTVVVAVLLRFVRVVLVWVGLAISLLAISTTLAVSVVLCKALDIVVYDPLEER